MAYGNLIICGLSIEVISFLAEAIREQRLILDCNGEKYDEDPSCFRQDKYFNAKTIEKLGVGLILTRVWNGEAKFYKPPDVFMKLEKSWD